jgi:hypothetical protein
MAIFGKNEGCVAIDHRLDAPTHHPTYVSLPYITFLVFWWRPLFGQKSVGLAFGIIENGPSCYFQQKWELCGH